MKRSSLLTTISSLLVLAVSKTSFAMRLDDMIDDDYLDQFCTLAQQVIASTKLTSTNTVFDELGVAGVPFPVPTPSTEFIASISTPYGPVGDVGYDLPLTTTQHVGYGIDPGGEEEYAQTIMCKMKDANALQYHFPQERPRPRYQDCSLISIVMLRLLRPLLGAHNRHANNIVFDDWITYAGNQWTAESPAPTAYLDNTDENRLHIVAKSLLVDRTDPSPFVTDERKGIQYCQVVAPAYLYKILTQTVTPPTCDPPPQYEFPSSGPPQVLSWDCANP